MEFQHAEALVELVTEEDLSYADCDANADPNIRADLMTRGYLKANMEPTPLGLFVGDQLARHDRWCGWPEGQFESYLARLAQDFADKSGGPCREATA